MVTVTSAMCCIFDTHLLSLLKKYNIALSYHQSHLSLWQDRYVCLIASFKQIRCRIICTSSEQPSTLVTEHHLPADWLWRRHWPQWTCLFVLILTSSLTDLRQQSQSQLSMAACAGPFKMASGYGTIHSCLHNSVLLFIYYAEAATNKNRA